VLYKKILLILLLILATGMAYSVHQLLTRIINPRRSFAHFMMFVLMNLATVFLIVFIFGFIIIHFNNFFFKN